MVDDIVRVPALAGNRAPLEAIPKDGVAEKGLETGRDIGAVVLETMEAIGRFVLSPSIQGHIRLLARARTPVPQPASATSDPFDTRHEETFGYADSANDLEIVNVRLVSIGAVDKPAVDFVPRSAGDPVIEHRSAWFGGWRETPILDRERLPPESRIDGPAIVEEAGGTTVVPPGWTIEVHPSGALMGTGNVRW